MNVFYLDRNFYFYYTGIHYDFMIRLDIQNNIIVVKDFIFETFTVKLLRD